MYAAAGVACVAAPWPAARARSSNIAWLAARSRGARNTRPSRGSSPTWVSWLTTTVLRPSGVGRSVNVRSACSPRASATMAKECGRSAATTVLRSSTGCAFHRKDAGRAAPVDAALPVDSTRTHRQARYHDGQRSTSVNRSHTRSAEAGITISLRTSIGGREAVLTGRSSRAETRVSHSRGMNRPLAAITLFRTPGMTTARPLSSARSPASMTGSGSASRR